MTRPYLLWLIWQNIDSRQRYHVGNLIHKDGLYIFQYENLKEHRGLKEALKDGYSPHLAFPDFNKVYVSEKLFGPFLRRLPNPGRPDFNNLLSKYGLTKDFTEMGLLRATGGRLATDPYEFVHPVYIEGNYFDFDFHIAGWRHHDGDGLLRSLTSESKLVFEKEPTNPYDPFAVMVKTYDNVLLGYVPAFFTEFMTDVINKELNYHVKIEKIDIDAIPQLKVKISVNGEFNINGNNHNYSGSNKLIPVEYV
ncbi:HIRAN domain-containing protein [Peribacillus frigoritolerans]|uniref:HIRAN domain-containing protein n=1 Tax=Peribacillus frigoritolerans TaxID=450367 RepID=UPI0025A24C30|nr:HIRAN domain-containing protein [Peribacillus frigoritolerans]MDM5309695.1 HIRAN domain-containing protein [Peribacillus frigoritolerans]